LKNTAWLPVLKNLSSDSAIRCAVNSRNHKDQNLKRVNKTSIAFNNHELKAINQYCRQFRVMNKAKFMREAIITEVLRKFDKHHPSLFDDHPRLF